MATVNATETTVRLSKVEYLTLHKTIGYFFPQMLTVGLV